MDFDMLTGLLTACELSFIEMGENVHNDAHMEFDLFHGHFPHTTDLKWTFSNVKNNSKSIGNVVFSHTSTHPV